VLGPVWVVPAYWWFVGVTLTLTLTDFDHKRIPNRILYPGFVVGVVLLGAGSALDGALGPLWRGLAGAAAYFTGLLVLAVIARGGFGFGDVKLATLLGLFAAHRSWGSLGVAALSAFIIGGLAGALLLMARRVGRKETIPFGPAMIVGAYLAVVWGDAIIEWYLG
jgi:leader peptidase (prepilin peptidase)/N-methyltransferase